MSGIAGIYNFGYKKKVGKDVLVRMGDSIKHRGPDASKIYINEDRSLGLIYRHLRIKNDEDSLHPICNEDGTIFVICDGEIYNNEELRRELITNGHHLKTHQDAELIIHLYEDYGYKCLDRLNGAFSFTLWDSKKQELFAARDRMGIKPLYYHYDGKSFLFASEIKALLVAKPSLRELNKAALCEYLSFQYCLHEKTLFKEVNKLPPAHFCTIKNGDIKIRRYWDVNFDIDSHHTEDYFIDTLRGLIEDSVRLRLISDVPIGTYLSGGIDSSAITCLVSSLLGSKLKTFTGTFKRWPDYDETKFAKSIAKFAKTDYFEINLKPKDLIDSISTLTYYMDEPAAGPGIFPQYFVAKLASKHVKIVLGGEGGDEIFGGYARYLIAYLEECLKGAIFETQTREDKRFIVTFSSILPNLPIIKEYVPMLQSFWNEGLFGPMDRRYFKLINRSNHLREVLNPELTKNLESSSFDSFSRIFNKKGIKSLFNKMSNFDLEAGLPAILHVDDRVNMSFSLESRAPFLDHRIVEFVASIPPMIKYRGGETKAIFKKAMRNIVPGTVLNRKDKKGFPVPLAEWYKVSLRGFIRDILLGSTTKKRGIYNTVKIRKLIDSERTFGRSIWGLLCLELWHREFIDKPCK